MRIERRQPTRAELKAAGVSRELVVRKIRPEKPKSADSSLSEAANDERERGADRWT